MTDQHVMLDRLETVSPAEQHVRDLVVEFALAWKRTLALAVRLGEALVTLKAELGHGRWLPWVEANFPLGVRTAQNFMDLADPANAQEIAHLPPGTTVTAALEWLADQRQSPRQLPIPGSVKLPEEARLLRFCQADLPTPTVVALMLRVFFSDAWTALDATYGSGNFWDGSAHVQVTGVDANPSRGLDGVVDFRQLHFGNASFDVVLFDPPHIPDAGSASIMGERFGSYSMAELPSVVMEGCAEAWRVAKLGCIVKVTDHSHSGRYVLESDWVRAAIGQPIYDVVHQTRSAAMVDPKWSTQMSAYNNGSTYLIFRKDGPVHRRRA